MSGLLFKPQDLQNELQSLRNLAEPLLDRATIHVLDELAANLNGLLFGGGKITLEIPEGRPLRTRISVGEFEPTPKKDGRRLYGEITGKWDVGLNISGKRNRIKLIEFCGKASTVIRLFNENNSGDAMAIWKIELGDAIAPGCYFHTHAGATLSGLPVPRHPSLFATPMAAIAFALGEIFQGKWEEAVSGNRHHQGSWRAIQKRRLRALLNWKLSTIDTTDSSPWISLKREKPSPELFLQ